MRDAGLLPGDVPLALLAARIEAGMGLHYPPAKERELAAALARISAAAGFARVQDCARWLADGGWSADKTALCARFLTIGETYFFREPRALELVADHARQRLAAGAGGLRVWSAGCCTGEEPYSIAIALRERLPQLAPARVSILATDLNETFLRFARAGEYRRWSFRRTPQALRQAYFEPADGDRLRVRAEVRAQVRFAQLNLALPLYPSAANGTQGLDVIFCRNVLMYFSREQMKKAVARFHACLADGGWLVVNPSEASAELFAGFEPRYFPDAVFFRKLAPGEAGAGAPHAAGRPAALQPAHARAAAAAQRAAPVPAAARPRRADPAAACAVAPAPADAAAGGGAHAQQLARAHALAQAGDSGAALQCLARAAEAAPLAAELHQAAALIALERGDAVLASQSLKRVLYLQPDSALAHYLLGVAEHAAGRRASARRTMQACEGLLAGAPTAALPGADGWDAGALRGPARDWLERVR